MAELFEQLPEVGDCAKPKIVFFFDEAHLLFNDAPEAFAGKIEQVVRLIRSKGVGIYFVTQNPLDIPDRVLGQLGNRIQHALRAFSPRDQKAVKAAAQTLRANPGWILKLLLPNWPLAKRSFHYWITKGVLHRLSASMCCRPARAWGPLRPLSAPPHLSIPLAGVYEQTEDSVSAYEQLTQNAAPINRTLQRKYLLHRNPMVVLAAVFKMPSSVAQAPGWQARRFGGNCG